MEETSIRRKYPWVSIILMIIPYVVIVGLFTSLAYSFLGLDINDADGDNTSWQDFTITLANAIGTVFAVWMCRAYIDRETFSSLGLCKILYIEILYGVFMGFVVMLIGFISLLLFDQIQYLNTHFIFSDFIAGLLMFLLVAILEELLRGYVLSNLMDSMNKYLALIISAVIFSVMHGGNPNFGWIPFFELVLAGILLGLSYIYTRNLGFPVALHFSWNFFQGTVFGFNVSGLDNYSIVQQVNKGDTIWNGGSFGFEGSVLSIILQVIAIVLIYKQFHKQGKEEKEGGVELKNTTSQTASDEGKVCSYT